VADTLKQLIVAVSVSEDQNPMTRKGVPNVSMQDVLGEQAYLGLVVEAIRLPFMLHGVTPQGIDNTAKWGPELLTICQLVHCLLRLMCSNHMNNQLSLFAHLDLLLAQLGTEMKAANTLLDLFRDNLPLLTRIKASGVEKMVQLVCSTRKPRFVSFLLVACSCFGNPIPRNQRAVFEACFCDPSIQVQLDTQLTETSVLLGLPGEKACNIDISSFLGQASEIFKADTSTLDPKALLFRYHQQVLELIFCLCNGRNRQSIDHFLAKDIVPDYKQLLQILHMKIPPLTKTAYARILLRCYVDREPYAPQKPIRLSRLWSKLPFEEVRFANVDAFKDILHKKPTPGFVDFKAFAANYMETLENPGSNWRVAPLTLQVIQLVELLVSFGLYGRRDVGIGPQVGEEDYDFGEVRATVDLFVDLLQAPVVAPGIDSRTDIMRCKLGALGLYEVFFNMRVNKRITMTLKLSEELFHDFGSIDGSLPKEEAPPLNTPQFSPPPPRSRASVVAINLDQEVELDSRLATLNQELFPQFQISDRLNETEFQDLLIYATQVTKIDLPGDSDVIVSVQKLAFSLLMRHQGQRAHFVRTLNSVQILVHEKDAKAIAPAVYAVDEVRRLYKWVAANKPDAYVEMESHLNTLLTLCRPRERGDMEGDFNTMEQVRIHQELLRNLGAHTTCIKLFGLPCQGNEPRKKLFQVGYGFLERFCYRNKPNQELLFEEIDTLAAHIAEEGLNAADCVGAIVKNHETLCENIPTSVIFQYVKLICRFGRKPQWLRQLTNLCMVNGEGVKRNQNIVLRAVVDTPGVIDSSGDEPMDAINRLVSSANEHIDPATGDLMETEDSQLAYYVESVNLLGAVTAGSNNYTEMQVKGLCPWDHCMERILDMGRLPSGEIDPNIHRDAVRYVTRPLLDLLREAHIYVLEVVSNIKDADGAIRWWADAIEPPRRCMGEEAVESMEELGGRGGEGYDALQTHAKYVFEGSSH